MPVTTGESTGSVGQGVAPDTAVSAQSSSAPTGRFPAASTAPQSTQNSSLPSTVLRGSPQSGPPSRGGNSTTPEGSQGSQRSQGSQKSGLPSRGGNGTPDAPPKSAQPLQSAHQLQQELVEAEAEMEMLREQAQQSAHLEQRCQLQADLIQDLREFSAMQNKV